MKNTHTFSKFDKSFDFEAFYVPVILVMPIVLHLFNTFKAGLIQVVHAETTRSHVALHVRN